MVDESQFEDWNMAKAFLMRVDDLLTTCALSQSRNDAIIWYKALYRLYIEIHAKLGKEEQTKAKELLINLTKLKNDAMKNGHILQVQPFVDLELYLRQMLEERHLITPRKDLSGL